MTGLEPAQTLWDLVDLDLEPLEPNDPRVVDTSAARGDFSRDRILRQLGVDPKGRTIQRAPARCYALLSGHRGCGKSTELRRLARDLHSPGGYWVVFVDALEALDPNNLQYPDVFLALAGELARSLAEHEAQKLELDAVHFSRLEQWFASRVESHTSTQDFAAEVKAGAKAEVGLPLLGRLFASITNAFKLNSTYKTELRKVVQNSFSEFAEAFNHFIKAAEEVLGRAGFHGRILFVVDGLDRLSTEDAHRFFVSDVHQLQQVDGVFIYVAPIHMLYTTNAVNQAFETFKLPMIKLNEKGSSDPVAAGYKALRELVFHRAARGLFKDDGVVDRLIACSGGHPRDLIRLLKYAYQHATGEVIDAAAAEAAIKSLESDYKRLLHASDYALLRRVDEATRTTSEVPSEPRVHELLHNLVLLEYNDYWWQTHPVVRRLPGYAVGAQGPSR